MSVGFIGCGNMASAIIEGVISSEVAKEEEIYVYDVYMPAIEKVSEHHKINVCNSESDVVYKSDTIILAVKPNVLGEVLEKIDTALKKSDALLISIAAGKTIEFIESHLTKENRIIRVMPNINAKVGEAISAYTSNKNVTQDDENICDNIFSGVGQVMQLDEASFPLFGVIAGCAPAFTYMFIDALARSGVKNGMKKDTALMISAQTVLGSAKMVLESAADIHPWELIDMVCSPGGTTIEGVMSLQKDGFEDAVHNAVDKAVEKDSKL